MLQTSKKPWNPNLKLFWMNKPHKVCELVSWSQWVPWNEEKTELSTPGSYMKCFLDWWQFSSLFCYFPMLESFNLQWNLSDSKMCMIFGAKQTPGHSSPFPFLVFTFKTAMKCICFGRKGTFKMHELEHRSATKTDTWIWTWMLELAMV